MKPSTCTPGTRVRHIITGGIATIIKSSDRRVRARYASGVIRVINPIWYERIPAVPVEQIVEATLAAFAASGREVLS